MTQSNQGEIPAEFAAKLQAARASRKMAGERRVITMLFCDVVGSTALAEGLDPEEWAEIMDDAFDFLIAPIFRYEGTLARMMGDAILAFFGAPIAHEDDPQRAIMAGLDIIREIKPYKEHILRNHGLSFDVRVGINTGPVVVGEMGSDLALEYTAMGDAINLAARMETTAAPGTVQIAQDTYRLVAPLFDVQPLGSLPVKGKSEPVKAYRVLGRKEEPGRLRGIEGLEAPLIGRGPELTTLTKSLANLQDAGQIIFLLGEAGLGKSRLIDELKRKATTDDDGRLLWQSSQAAPYEANQPYSAVRRSIRAMIGLEQGDMTGAIEAKINSAVSRYVLDEAALAETALKMLFLGAGDASGPGTGKALAEAEALKRALFAFLRASYMDSLSQGPAVLVFDDLHWIDPASAELLADLFQLVERFPVLILCAMRTYRDASGWRVREVARERFGNFYQELHLTPLSERESDALVDSLLAISELPPPLRRMILKKTEGNPFFVEEVIRSLIETGVVVRDASGLHWMAGTPVDDIDIPDSLQSLLISRIDRLDKDCRRTLQLASVVGRSFYGRLLATIADHVEKLDSHLAALITAEMIVETASVPEPEYAFRHGLTRDAAYKTILRRERRVYHRRVALALEEMSSGRIEEEAHRLAFHFEEAGLQEKALGYYTMAGEAAASIFANTEAASFFARALTIARRVGTTEQLVKLFKRRGRAFELNGQYDEAIENYLEMDQAGQEKHEPILVIESLLARALLGAIATSAYDPRLAAAQVEEALALADETGLEHTRSKAFRIRTMFRGRGLSAILEDRENALAIARKYDLREQEAFALYEAWGHMLSGGLLDEAIEAVEKSGEIFQALNNLPMLIDNRVTYGGLLIYRGRLKEAREVVEEALETARRIGNLWGQAYASLGLFFVYFQMAEIGLARMTARRAARLAQKANFIIVGIYFRAIEVILQLTVGDVDGLQGEIEDLARETASITGSTDEAMIFAVTLILYHLEKGDVAGARRELERIQDLSGDRGLTSLNYHSGVMLALPDARISLLEGDFEGAVTAADIHIRFLEERGIRRLLDQYYLVKGEALRELGQIEASRSALDQGLKLNHESGYCIVTWRFHAQLALLEKTTGNDFEAKKQRQKAIEGVQYIVDRMDSKAQRAAFLNRFEIQELFDSTKYS